MTEGLIDLKSQGDSLFQPNPEHTHGRSTMNNKNTTSKLVHK